VWVLVVLLQQLVSLFEDWMGLACSRARWIPPLPECDIFLALPNFYPISQKLVVSRDRTESFLWIIVVFQNRYLCSIILYNAGYMWAARSNSCRVQPAKKSVFWMGESWEIGSVKWPLIVCHQQNRSFITIQRCRGARELVAHKAKEGQTIMWRRIDLLALGVRKLSKLLWLQ
jgi:hypothetical protein